MVQLRVELLPKASKRDDKLNRAFHQGDQPNAKKCARQHGSSSELATATSNPGTRVDETMLGCQIAKRYEDKAQILVEVLCVPIGIGDLHRRQ